MAAVIAVCVVTYQRPHGLQRLLTGLEAQTFRDEPPEVSITVVDNDADESAREVCDAARATLRWPLLYEIEPRRGIPFARNKAIESAVDHADFVAFIDDDEVPDPCWLDELTRIQRLHEADVVAGPVVPYFPEKPPSWAVKGRVFDLPRHRTGYQLRNAYTGNVLVTSRVFKGMGALFDERMTLTGGSDTHFFRRVSQAGFKIVWADDALVREWIPASRACFGWLVRRAFRSGNSMAIIDLDLKPSWFTPLVLAAKAGVWMAIGVVLVPWGIVAGRHTLVKAGRSMAYGMGLAAGMVGGRYEEYRTTHGN